MSIAIDQISKVLIDRTPYMVVGLLISLVVCFFTLSNFSAEINNKLGCRSPSVRQRFLEGGGLFLVLVGVFFVISRLMFNQWYIGDDAFDSCVMPYQFANSEPIWGGGTNYLTYLYFYLLYCIFGFSAYVATSGTAVIFALSLGFLYGGVRLLLGVPAAVFLVLSIAASYQFLAYSVFATAITFGFLSPAVIFFLLTTSKTFLRIVVMHVLIVCGAFMYPSATVYSALLLFIHQIIFRNQWPRYLYFLSFVTFFLDLLALYLIRQFTLTSGTGDVTQWAGGWITFADMGQSIGVVLRDLFWESTSWNTFNVGVPYFDPVLIGFFLVGIFSSMMSATSRRVFGRWVFIAYSALLGTVIVTAAGGPYPGVRRVLPALPLAFLPLGIAFDYIINFGKRWGVRILLVLIPLCIITLRTYFIAETSWPISSPSPFVMDSEQFILDHDIHVEAVFLKPEIGDQFLSQHYRCALGFNERIALRVGKVKVLPENLQLVKTNELPCRFLLLANEEMTTEELFVLFGRQTSKEFVVRPGATREGYKLVAAYLFER